MPKSKMINGLSFEIREPYAEGQTINAAEAKALNQVRSENIGNNLRSQIKALQEKSAPEAEITALVAAYDAEYTLTLSAVSSARKLDPVEKEALAIARELVKNHLASQGRKLSTVPEGMTKEEWEDKLEANYESIAAQEDVIAEAKKAVKAKEARASKLAGALNL